MARCRTCWRPSLAWRLSLAICRTAGSTTGASWSRPPRTRPRPRPAGRQSTRRWGKYLMVIIKIFTPFIPGDHAEHVRAGVRAHHAQALHHRAAAARQGRAHGRHQGDARGPGEGTSSCHDDELETKAIRRFVITEKAPLLLGPSPG